MITKNEQSVNTENAVECEFGNAIRELGNSSILKKSNIRKKKGGSVLIFSSPCYSLCSKTATCIISRIPKNRTLHFQKIPTTGS